jgi:hypothetical protein
MCAIVLRMTNLNDEAIKVRVPASIKARLQSIAESKLCSISDVAREAILLYLARADSQIGTAEAPADTKRKKPGPPSRPSLTRAAAERAILGVVKAELAKRAGDPPGGPR